MMDESSGSTSPFPAGQSAPKPEPTVDWRVVARLVLTSRYLDEIEETELASQGRIAYQFSTCGHELPQVLLGLALDHPHDGASGYYRSRSFMLASGLTVDEALAAGMGRSGSPTKGRDVGVVYSLPPRGGATVLPMSGAVGSQYAPAAGWAAAIRYRQLVMEQEEWQGAAAVAMGGEGSVATPGFWAALNMATTRRLPLLFLIEDNGYAISVPADRQVYGANIAANLSSWPGLLILDGDGTEPPAAAHLVRRAVDNLRAGHGPVLLRMEVPRLAGHSFADTALYKSADIKREDEARDPLPRLRRYLVPQMISEGEWDELESEVRSEVAAAAERVAAGQAPDPAAATRFVFYEPEHPPEVGGTLPERAGLPLSDETSPEAQEPVRVNMVDAIRRTMETEMRLSGRVLVFGEDVGRKGGLHGATRDMQLEFGPDRVCDTGLNEESIIGRAVGMALAGLVPIPEIQFRKYADPATEQLHDCGTIRWRTAGRFAAPIVVRVPVGVSRSTGDPWHSETAEAPLAHSHGWRIACPSNARDAVGLLRTALRGNDPSYFLEHRALYDSAEARRPYPGDEYQLPFGRAKIVLDGTDLTVVTWGLMVHRTLEAAADFPGAVEIVDLRTIVPWDSESVLESVRKTGRCLVVHEDRLTAGFGAEIAAFVGEAAFTHLDAPVSRLAAADCPVPYDSGLMATVVPDVPVIGSRLSELLTY